LVQCLPRQTGCKESRYAHLLAGPAETGPATGTPAGIGRHDDGRIARLEEEVEGMRRELAALKTEFAEFKKRL
jgi:uncharacterized protein